MIGITLTPAASPVKDPATRAYRLGFTGYELGLADVFELPVEEVVSELQRRLKHARAAATV